MRLSSKEKNIIYTFKKEIEEKFPKEIIEILIFGSKARGDAAKDSDIDILVITKASDKKIIKEIRSTGYDLEIDNDIVLSIQVLSRDYVDYLRNLPTQFIQNVDRDAIAL
ncbi:MAG: nucleotidyltransferase family protein [Actinomycetota bacterium]